MTMVWLAASPISLARSAVKDICRSLLMVIMFWIADFWLTPKANNWVDLHSRQSPRTAASTRPSWRAARLPSGAAQWLFRHRPGGNQAGQGLGAPLWETSSPKGVR